MSKIQIYSLGGTIAMTSVGPGGSIIPTLSAADLAAYLPERLTKGLEIEGHSFRQLSGSSVGFADLAALLDQLRHCALNGVNGFVVTMGTDSIEEASFLIDLLWERDEPVVVTGAMRGPSHISPDGAFNLAAAVTTAGHPQARGRGCLVVLNDEIHCARWVRKVHTTSGNAFSSGIVGTAGVLVEDEVRFLQPVSRPPVYPQTDLSAVRTALLISVIGDEGTLYTKLDDGSFDGVVIAGFGAGHVPGAAVEAIDKLANRIPIVLATRVDSGPTLRRTYGYPGSEVDLLSRGLICADLLDALKARLLLHVLVANGLSRDEIEAAFDAHTYGDGTPTAPPAKPAPARRKTPKSKTAPPAPTPQAQKPATPALAPSRKAATPALAPSGKKTATPASALSGKQTGGESKAARAGAAIVTASTAPAGKKTAKKGSATTAAEVSAGKAGAATTSARTAGLGKAGSAGASAGTAGAAKAGAGKSGGGKAGGSKAGKEGRKAAGKVGGGETVKKGRAKAG